MSGDPVVVDGIEVDGAAEAETEPDGAPNPAIDAANADGDAAVDEDADGGTDQ